MAISQMYIDQIRLEHSNALRGRKTAVVKKYANLLNCSDNKIWAALNTGRKRRREQEKTKPLREVTEMVFKLKNRVPDGTPLLSTDQAISILQKNGSFPQETPTFSKSSIDKMGRRLKLGKKSRRIQRFQAERPNQMHHIDASSSQFLYVVKALPNGDYLLKLHTPSMMGYKNKPIPIHQRLLIYGLTDDYSGYALAQYTAAPGESALDNLHFLEWVWGNTEDKLFNGLPDKVKSDKGPLMRGKSTENFFNRLEIEIDPSVPGAKDAHGKIERPWRTHWQRFEKPYLVLDNWREFTITLSELNRQLLIYFKEDYNCRSHRHEKDITREQAWRRINQFGGVRQLPAGAFESIFEEDKRKVKADGTFSLDSKLYEVKGLHDTWVNVQTGLFTGEMQVQDIETGEIYEVIDFEPNPIGKFTAHKDTPQQKSKKAGKDLQITKTPFEEEKEAGNVVPLPARVQEEQQFDRVFNNDTYASLFEAMTELQDLTDSIFEAGSDDRAYAEELLVKNKLRKTYVKELAGIINVHNKQEVAHG